MSTRAGAACASSLAKTKLVRLLFQEAAFTRNHSMHQHHDYQHLRSAYLKRIQTLHPDKFFLHQQDEQRRRRTKRESKERFVELQLAWKNYDRIMKQQQTLTKQQPPPSSSSGTFTMFGVGCSFADSPKERDCRAKIMDRACRGWLVPSAALPVETVEPRPHPHDQAMVVSSKPPSPELLSLCDDDMFVVSTTLPQQQQQGEQQQQQQQQGEQSSQSSLNQVLEPECEDEDNYNDESFDQNRNRNEYPHLWPARQRRRRAQKC